MQERGYLSVINLSVTFSAFQFRILDLFRISDLEFKTLDFVFRSLHSPVATRLR